MRDKETTRLNGAQPPRGSIKLRRLVTNLRRVRQDPDAKAELIETAEDLADKLEEATNVSV
jgi:hypothetical protein